MLDSKIFEGKTTNEAIENGLKELKVSKNDVEIKILENEEKRSFFDILAPRVVKVELTLKEKNEGKRNTLEKRKEYKIDENVLENAKNAVNDFLAKFLKEVIGKEANYTCIAEESIIKVDIKEENADFLIGYRGETLNSLQTLLTAIADKNAGEKVKVEVNALGYREKRKVALEELAEKLAKTVVRNRKSVTLEPMTPYERKIIHTKLQEHPKVKTISIGEGTHRKVVISLK
mgnify:CR=1 FL=1